MGIRWGTRNILKVSEQTLPPGKDLIGINLNILDNDISDLLQNLEVVKTAITAIVVRTIAEIVTDLLARSQPRVPYDTGELRKSGIARVILGGTPKIVATGNEDGTISARLEGITSRLLGKRPPTKISGDVSYYRMGSPGFDVALFTHEYLYAYEQRPSTPAARQPGTGPKYLAIPFLQNKNRYVAYLQKALQEKLPKVLLKRVKKNAKSNDQFTVDIVKLVLRDIESTGFFGI